MRRLYYELFESIRIAFAQIRANTLRSALTALGEPCPELDLVYFLQTEATAP